MNTKSIVEILGAAALACAAVSAQAGTDVGVSISVMQPGVYGRIDIGNAAPPPVVYAQPMIIAPGPVAVVRRPVYLYVPPGHQKNWGKYCGRYNACGQPVYFVQERWVRDRYDERHGQRRGDGDWQGNDDHDRGRGHGNGNGHGRGHDKHGD